jgi:hypothetical protein
MHRLSCNNGNESSHEAEEEEMALSASSTTSGTPNDSTAGGTESNQPPTRHRRDADDVSPLLLGTRLSTSTLAAETNGSSTGMTGSYDVILSTVETVSTNNVTPQDIHITTQEVTAPVVISAADGLTLTRNHEQRLYTTRDPSMKAATTEAVRTEYFVTIVPYNTSVTDKGMMQKMIVEKPHQDQSTEKTEITGSISSTPVIISPTGLSTVNTAVETSASPGILYEVKEITVSFEEDNITKNNTEDIKIRDEILLTETVSETASTSTVGNTINMTVSTENINTPDEDSNKQNGKESPVLTKPNTATDDQMAQNLKEENHHLQFLPASLQGVPHDRDNETNETGDKSTSDWASPNNQHDEGEQFQQTETEPEVPARPNRGRRLIRPQSHLFYPYFLNRVLG